LGEVLDILCAPDQAPVDDRHVQYRAAPFHIGEGDLAKGAAPDGAQDARMAERLDIAQPLQRELIAVDAARTVGHQDQFQIDGGLPGRRARADCRQHQKQPNPSFHGVI
jgi:hypothetical protein